MNLEGLGINSVNVQDNFEVLQYRVEIKSVA